ncbi:MAG: hypothetical protein ACM3NH_02965, partial [Candidatus Saccharibacteria bacterium]
MAAAIAAPFRVNSISAEFAQAAAPAKASLSDLRIPFVENEGQIADERVKFKAEISSGSVFVTDKGLSYALQNSDKTNEEKITSYYFTEEFKDKTGETVGLSPKGNMPAATKVSSFIGADMNKWKSSLPSYEEVELGEIWPGTGATLKAYGGKIEKVFTTQPGGDPSQIRLAIEGGKLKLVESGELSFTIGGQEFRMTKPVAYQIDAAGVKSDVDVSYRI